MSTEARLEVQWQEVSAEQIVQFWVQAYRDKPEDYVWFYDPAKQKFLLRLYVRVAVSPDEPE